MVPPYHRDGCKINDKSPFVARHSVIRCTWLDGELIHCLMELILLRHRLIYPRDHCLKKGSGKRGCHSHYKNAPIHRICLKPRRAMSCCHSEQWCANLQDTPLWNDNKSWPDPVLDKAGGSEHFCSVQFYNPGNPFYPVIISNPTVIQCIG